MSGEGPGTTFAAADVHAPELLDANALKLWEWLQTDKVSRVRMLATWQGAGGLSFVAQCYHRAMQCFKYHGNAEYSEGDSAVSLEEVQRAVKSRHRIGSNGIGEAGTASASATSDFA